MLGIPSVPVCWQAFLPQLHSSTGGCTRSGTEPSTPEACRCPPGCPLATNLPPVATGPGPRVLLTMQPAYQGTRDTFQLCHMGLLTDCALLCGDMLTDHIRTVKWALQLVLHKHTRKRLMQVLSPKPKITLFADSAVHGVARSEVDSEL